MKWCSQAPFYWEATSESSSQCWNGSFCEMRMVFPLAAVLLLSPKWEQFPVYLPGAYHNITVGRHFADIWSVWRSLCGHNHPVMTHSYRNCPLWGRFRERIASACDSISFSCLHIEKLQYQRKHPIFLVLEAAWQKLNQFIAYLEIYLKGTRTWNIFSASAPMVAWGACSIKKFNDHS